MFKDILLRHRTYYVPLFYICGYKYLVEAAALLKHKDVSVSTCNS